jgi:hypothetical protein
MKRSSVTDEAIERAIANGAKVLTTKLPGIVNRIPGEVDKTGGAEGKPRRSKYNAKPTVYNGVRYDSKAEAERAKYLDSAITGIREHWWIAQPKFRLGCPENVYVADFLVCSSGKVHVEDVKGMMTPKFRRDMKLWQRYGPCQLWVITKGKIQHVNGGMDFECRVNGTAGHSTIEEE